MSNSLVPPLKLNYTPQSKTFDISLAIKRHRPQQNNKNHKIAPNASNNKINTNVTCNILQRIIRQPFLVYTRQTMDSIALELDWTCFSNIVQWLYKWKLTINYAYRERSVMWTVCLWLVHFMLRTFCIFSVFRFFSIWIPILLWSALCNFSWENSSVFSLARDYPHFQLCLAQTTPMMRETNVIIESRMLFPVGFLFPSTI